MKMEAEIGATQLRTEQPLETLGAGRGEEGTSPTVSRGSTALLICPEPGANKYLLFQSIQLVLAC